MSENLITSQPFNCSSIVACGYCRGTGIGEVTENGRITCKYCNGDGRLKRVSKGVVEIYKLENNNQISSNNKQ